MQKIYIVIALLGVLAMGSFLLIDSKQEKYSTPLPVLSSKEDAVAEPVEEKPIIPLEEKIGKLFMVGHWAHTPAASTTALIEKHHLGGVIIMSAPEYAREIVEWTREWQKAASGTLLISIDQEGGLVTRLKGAEFTQRSQRQLVTREEAYALGKERGKELDALGITMNFAPVLDSAANKDSFMYQRVFADKKRSALFANEMIQGMESQGVTAVTKHFPGHDDTADDSHQVLPTVSVSKDKLDAFTLPFRKLIEDGKPKALMTAHVLFPNIDKSPATLSYFFLTEYLRESLGFNGVIFTDDVSMDAIDTNYGLGSATVKAVQAGADIILFAAEPTKVTEGIGAVLTAVKNGELSEKRIDESYNRIKLLR
jgi:beta-N-acetylhexosaminidase